MPAKKHPCPRRSAIFLSLLALTGALTLVLFKIQSCYDPCAYVENVAAEVFGFWDRRPPFPMTECKIPGLAKQLCTVPQTHPLFYVVFDLLVLVALAYLANGLWFLSKRRTHR